jgi:hypothetical protein
MQALAVAKVAAKEMKESQTNSKRQSTKEK